MKFGTYTAGIPLTANIEYFNPSIYGIAEAIPTGIDVPENDFYTSDYIYRTEVSAPFLQSNAWVWVALGFAALLLLSGNKKGE